MQFRLQRSWRRGTCKKVSVLLLAASTLLAYPDRERTPASFSQPPLDLVSSQASAMALNGDQFLFLAGGEEISRVDLETWELARDQVPDLEDHSDEPGGEDLRGDVVGLAIRSGFLFASQTDGDLLAINLAKMTEDPDSVDLGSSTLGPVVADPEIGSDDDKLYIADRTLNAVLVYDIGEGRVLRTISLSDSLGNTVTPVALAFAQFPTNASSDTTDKIYVTSNRGLLFVILEGGSAVSKTITLSSTNVDLPALALSPQRNFLFVVNQTNGTVHVIHTTTDSEVDTDSSTGGTNPISVSPNGSPKGIAVMDVTDPADTYATVSGSGGLTVIDLNLSVSMFDGFSRIDFNDTGGTDIEDDPMTLSSTPGPIIATSRSDARLFTSNGNARISIIGDQPFVTVRTTSLGSSSLTSGGSFTIAFQSDEAGSYTVRAGGDLTQTGTLVDSGKVGSANSDVTTGSIAYSSATFSEGRNRIFVFVTDSEGNVGRDAVDITVDTPPSAIEISRVGFGSGNLYLTFKRLTASDVSSYSIYVEPDTDGDGDCSDESIGTKSGSTGSLTQTSSGKTLTAKISGLTNGVAYCLGVEGLDLAGNVGARTTTLTTGGPAIGTPETAIGIAASAGESGCTLRASSL